MPARPLILIGVLLLVLAVPLSHGAWGAELPWKAMIAAAVGPATVYYLLWFYWRDSRDQDATQARKRIIVLVGVPIAAVAGVLLAGGSDVLGIAAAATLGAALGFGAYFFMR